MSSQKNFSNTRLEELSPAEWDFEALNLHIEEAAAYEFARECPGVIEAVRTWRKQWSEEHLGALIMLRISLGILPLFPEFPDQPWLAIDLRIRSKRVNEFRKELEHLRKHIEKAGDTPKAFDVLNPLESRGRIKALIIRAETAAQFPEVRNFIAGQEDLLCSIDWSKPTNQLIRDFDDWVRANRPPAAAKPTKSEPNERRSRDLLKALAAFRLLRHFHRGGVSQENAITTAMEFTQRQKKQPPLYATREAWLRAVERARQHLLNFNGVSAQLK